MAADLLPVLAPYFPDLVDARVHDAGGAFDPVGIMLHHTVSPEGSGEFTSRKTVTQGRGGASPLSPPLCNALGGRGSGRLMLVSNGRANDSGMGSGVVLRDIQRGIAPSGDAAARGLADTLNLNPYYYDLELENNGTGEPFGALWETALRFCEAICRWKGWGAERVVAHRESTKRKIDPQRSQWDMHAFRAELAGRLGHAAPAPVPVPTPTPAPTPTSGGSFVAVTANLPVLREGMESLDVSVLQSILNVKAGQALVVDGEFGGKTKTAVLNWQRFFFLADDGIVGGNTWRSLLEIP